MSPTRSEVTFPTAVVTDLVNDTSPQQGGFLDSNGHNIQILDNDKLTFGTGFDLQIFHDGSNSYVREVGTGNLFIESPNNIFIGKSSGGAENCIVAKPDGEVELYHDNSKKFETRSNGVHATNRIIVGESSTDRALLRADSTAGGVGSISNIPFYLLSGGLNRWSVTAGGNFIPAANNAYDIGNTTYRVRNIYTNDLNLSNEGSSNDVDGTWGSYTIQEGEEDLFLINKRNGKKYKFNLTEVN